MRPSRSVSPATCASRLTLLIPLVLLVIVFMRWHSERLTGAEEGETAPRIPGSEPTLPPPTLAFASAETAWTAETTFDEKAVVLQQAIERATAAMPPPQPNATLPVMAPIPPLDPRRSAMAHRNFPLSETQRLALEKLRWRTPGKRIEWRSAAQKPVLIYLEGRRLQEGATVAESGRTLAETTARQFLRNNVALLGAGEGDVVWQLAKETRDELGYTQVRFDQRWQGLEVWPGALMVQTAPGGDVTLVTASYAPEPNLDTITPALSTEEARRVALAGKGLLPPGAAASPELLIHAPLESSAPRLAWRVRVDAGLTDREEVFVDAQDGSAWNACRCW